MIDVVCRKGYCWRQFSRMRSACQMIMLFVVTYNNNDTFLQHVYLITLIEDYQFYRKIIIT